MDGFIRDVAAAIDDDTVLIVMGDHGMDEKGDHGGESDDEIEAALWMYSSRPVFGRTKPEFATPPATAKIHPVNQIDLVPTLALLLGIPIPYNSLGRPIEEAFAGIHGNSWDELAAAERSRRRGHQALPAVLLCCPRLGTSHESWLSGSFMGASRGTGRRADIPEAGLATGLLRFCSVPRGDSPALQKPLGKI